MTSTHSGCPRGGDTNSREDGSASFSSLMPFFSDPLSSSPTSTSARQASFRPEIDVEGTATKVLVEQLGAVDVTHLGDLAGHLTPEEQWGLDTAILTVLGLS